MNDVMTKFASITNPNFFRGGNAIFTCHNDKIEHYTFKIRKPRKKRPDDPEKPFFAFVSKKEGFVYMGIYNPETNIVTLTPKSPLYRTPDCRELKVLNWGMRVVAEGEEKLKEIRAKGYNIHHEGRCCSCAKQLTTPESVSLGIGPECLKRKTGW